MRTRPCLNAVGAAGYNRGCLGPSPRGEGESGRPRAVFWCETMSIETTYLDRILDPVAECFTPGVARRLVELQADSQTQAHLDALAEKASQGQLSPEEDAEYKQAIDAIDLLAILQAKARAYLRRHPASD